MNFKKKYGQYLASPQWKELRAAARARSNNQCEMCGGSPDHVHHVRYPKRYEDDHVDNLLVVCEVCHSKLHGIRTEIYVDDWLASATKITHNGTVPAVLMKFSPLPKDMRNPVSFIDFTKRVGEKQADEIRNQFDGYLVGEDETFSRLLTMDHPIFYELGMVRLDEFFASLLEEVEAFDVDNHARLGHSVLRYFSVGPILVAFKKS